MKTKHPSFSSPYKVESIDQIPTPILKLLVSLGPCIKIASQCVQIVLWKSPQPRLSILAVLAWISLCIWTWQILALGVPTLVLYKLAQDWLNVRTNRARREKLERVRHEQRKKREEKLKEHEEEDRAEEEKELVSRKIRQEGDVSLDDTLENLVVINHFLDYVSNQTKNAMTVLNEANPISILSVLMYLAPVWISLNWWFGAQIILACIGTLILISSSPWFHIIMESMMRNVVLRHILIAMWAYGVAVVTTVFRFDLKLKERVKNMMLRAVNIRSKANTYMTRSLEKRKKDTKGSRSEMIFQFEVFENQRWWLGVHWTTNMMPNERTPWTDGQLKPISNKDDFNLPEGSTKTGYRAEKKEKIQVTTEKTWSWADNDWWVDMTGELQGKIDQNGWEYGNNAWKQLGGVPGLQTFTRRRRWCRRARLVEQETEGSLWNDNEEKHSEENYKND